MTVHSISTLSVSCIGGQHLGAPPGVGSGPPVAAVDAAGHTAAVVGAVDVVPARVAAERAGATDVASLAVAFKAVPARHAIAVRAWHDGPLPGGVMVTSIVVTSLRAAHSQDALRQCQASASRSNARSSLRLTSVGRSAVRTNISRLVSFSI